MTTIERWLCLSVALPIISFAQTVWVSDEIQAPLRKSPSSRAEIVGFIEAGQAAQKLAEKTDDEGTKYTQVKLSDGRTGWLTNYYVLTRESVHAKLAPMQAELAKAKSDLDELNATIEQQAQKITELQSGVSTAESKLADAAETKMALNDLQSVSENQDAKIAELTEALEIANKRAEKERLRYASLAKVSQDAVRIDNQNQQLQEKAIQLEQNLQLVQGENETLRTRTNKSEWYTGAAIVIFGVLTGLVIPLFFRRRRYR